MVADDSPPISAALNAYDLSSLTRTGNGVPMKDATAEMAKKTNQNKRKAGKPLAENIALHRRYGQIGISAVAAAVRYQGGAKNPAYAPVAVSRQDQAVA